MLSFSLLHRGTRNAKILSNKHIHFCFLTMFNSLISLLVYVVFMGFYFKGVLLLQSLQEKSHKVCKKKSHKDPNFIIWGNLLNFKHIVLQDVLGCGIMKIGKRRSLMCKLCKERGKTWRGDDPKCAFNRNKTLRKDLDNWNCALLGGIREIANSLETDEFQNKGLRISYHWGSEEENGLMVSYEGVFLFMQWYKSRGRTSHVVILNHEPLNEEDSIYEIFTKMKEMVIK
jgi:hypothetical protein